VIFDEMQVVAELHSDRIDDALVGIAKIINLKPYGQHLLVFIHEALKKVVKAMYQTISTAGPTQDGSSRPSTKGSLGTTNSE
jgi:hypothetical protein